jgi:hypothetical protein
VLDLEPGPLVTKPLQKVGDPLPFSPLEVKLIGEFDAANDADGDSIQDLGDNCPFIGNPLQENDGGFFDDTLPDTLGNACQCAEGSGDGAIFEEDFDAIFDLLAGKITNPLVAKAVRERCSIVGTTECNIRDLVYLRKAIDDVAVTTVETRCDAALSPVPTGP